MVLRALSSHPLLLALAGSGISLYITARLLWPRLMKHIFGNLSILS